MTSKIVRFAEEVLGLNLYPKQKEILTNIWEQKDKQTWVLALGRRSGKTLMSAILALYCAVVNTPAYAPYRRDNEPIYVFIVANSEAQSKIALGMIKQLIDSSPIISGMVTKSVDTEVHLNNGFVFKALPANASVNRGYGTALLIFDELAFTTETESKVSGKQIADALKPGQAQYGMKSRTIQLSSPWLDSGFFWEEYNYAKEGGVGYGFIHAPTWEVNPTIDPEFLEMQKQRSPETFIREYGAEFTGAVNQFLASELIEAATENRSVPESPIRKYRGHYYLSLDPASGAVGCDQYVACIAHYEREGKVDILVVDAWHVFSPTYINGKKKEVEIAQVEQWIIDKHKDYGLAKIVLDQHQSKSTIQRLQSLKLGSKVEELTWTVARKMEAYSKMRELFVGGNISIYKDDTAIKQLKGLAIVHSSNGNFTVTGGSRAAVDDYAAALAGCVLIAKAINPVNASIMNSRCGSNHYITG